MSGNITRGGTNTRLDPDVTGSRCAKPDPRCPTRLSAKVLISIIYCAIHSVSAKSLWREISKNCYLIDRLATDWHVPTNKPVNIEEHCRKSTFYSLTLLLFALHLWRFFFPFAKNGMTFTKCL